VTRPKGELISQKGGRRSTSLSQSHRQSLLFDAKSPLTSKNSPPILQPPENNVLSKRTSSVLRYIYLAEFFAAGLTVNI
jgi:hypothetical protein